jgi:hypothetical protein
LIGSLAMYHPNMGVQLRIVTIYASSCREWMTLVAILYGSIQITYHQNAHQILLTSTQDSTILQTYRFTQHEQVERETAHNVYIPYMFKSAESQCYKESDLTAILYGSMAVSR